MLTFDTITTITPSALSDPTPGYEVHVYDDDTPFSHMQNGLPPISVEIPIATSQVNTRGPPSSVTTPHSLMSPGLVSPSQPAYLSSPSQPAGTPPTPGYSLDVYSPYTHSAPVSPYLTQHPPWHTSHPVCVSSIRSAFVPLTSSRSYSNRLRSQSVHSANANGDPWCHRSVTSLTLPVTDVATLMKSTLSHPSTSICKSPMKQGYH